MSVAVVPSSGWSPHPFALRLPPLSDSEYADLRDDIAANGQRIPIVFYEDQVLDGVHRLTACDELDIAPVTETFEGSELEALAFVISVNLRRRHLSKDVLAAIGVETLLDDLRAAATARMEEAGRLHGRGKPPPEAAEAITEPEAVEQVAKTVGVGKAKVRQAEQVRVDRSAALDAQKVFVDALFDLAVKRGANFADTGHRLSDYISADEYQELYDEHVGGGGA